MALLQELLFVKVAASAVLAAGLGLVLLLRGRSAAFRSRVLAVAVLLALVLLAGFLEYAINV